MFCGCATEWGAAPNHQTCPVCLGLPGTLPVINRIAVEYALTVALALDCRIARPFIFERKNYYYPDLPKNYQISQKRTPLGYDGHFDLLLDGRTVRVGIPDVHLEEDAGRLLHPESDARGSLVDFNRAGMPLLEIVSAPDLTSLDEVAAYMETLQQLLRYLGVSEARMERGQLRFEANISLREPGAPLGKRVEIKNLNSHRAVLRSLEYEIERQAKVLRAGKPVAQETRLWNEEREVSGAMRSKEEAHDYRYFPEPDLAPIAVDDALLTQLRARIPELPTARRKRFIEAHGLPAYDAGILTADRALADYFEAALAAHSEPKAVSNWVINDVSRYLNDRGETAAAASVTPARLGELLGLVARGEVTTTVAKRVLQQMFETGRGAADIVQAEGLGTVQDASALQDALEKVLAANADAVEKVRAGNEAPLKFLVGQVMRETRGTADVQAVLCVIRERLGV